MLRGVFIFQTRNKKLNNVALEKYCKSDKRLTCDNVYEKKMSRKINPFPRKRKKKKRNGIECDGN